MQTISNQNFVKTFVCEMTQFNSTNNPPWARELARKF